MTAGADRFSLLADTDLDDSFRQLLPPHLQVVAAPTDGLDDALVAETAGTWLAALVDSANRATWRERLTASGMANVPIIAVDRDAPERLSQDLLELLSARLGRYQQAMGETRAAAALLRRENLSDKTRFREIESFLYTLGNPQVAQTLSWQPSGLIRRIEGDATIIQKLPINAVSISVVDLWLPELPRNRDLGLTVSIIDAGGVAHDLTEAYAGQETQTGWVRFTLAKPLGGDARNCMLMLRYAGRASVAIGMGPRAPDPRFSAKGEGMEGDEVMALRVWKAVAGAAIPDEPMILQAARNDQSHARFLSPGALPAPELFSKPASATDYVTVDYWAAEDAVMVHPSRFGPVCAVLRDVWLPQLTHLTAVVNVGHPLAPSLNLAVGVAPAGTVGRDGIWQSHMGWWVHGLPAHGWAQAHCVPPEAIADRVDIFLAVSLTHDVPNDLGWGLFRGLRVVTGVPLDDQDE